MLIRVIASALLVFRRIRAFAVPIAVLVLLGLLGMLVSRLAVGTGENAAPGRLLASAALVFLMSLGQLWVVLGLKNIAMAVARGAADASSRAFYPIVKAVQVFVLWLLPGFALGMAAITAVVAMQAGGKGGPAVVALMVVGACFVATVISQIAFLILDGRAGVLDAYAASYALTKGYKLEAFLVLIACQAGPLIIVLEQALRARGVTNLASLPTPSMTMQVANLAASLVFELLAAGLGAGLYLELTARRDAAVARPAMEEGL